MGRTTHSPPEVAVALQGTLDTFALPDVLRLLAQGLSNSAIADRLGLSLKTVNNNTSSIFTKLNAASRTEAAIMARERGLGHP